MSFRTASVIQQFFLDSAMVKNGSLIELAWRTSGKFERLASRGMVLIGALVFFYTHPHKNTVFFCLVIILGPNLLSKDPGRVILPLPGVGGMSPNMLLPLCET